MQESNYDVMVRQARGLFLQYDQDAMLRKFGLNHDENAMYVPLLDAVYRLDRRTGAVTCGDQAADFNAAMSIYDILCFSKERPCLGGRWKSLGALSRIASWHQRTDQLLAVTAGSFAGKAQALQAAFAALGGVRGPTGDAGGVLPFFPFFPVCVQFWDGDDEFPPTLRILWDDNALDFVHYETLWYMSGFLCRRLQTLCGG